MKHVTELLQLFVAGELDGPRKHVVEEHLKKCSACRDEADQALRLWEDLGSVGPVLSNESVWPSVRARTFGAGSRQQQWFFGSGGLARGALAATALAAGLTLGILVPVNEGPDGDVYDPGSDSSWLLESSWLSESSWLGGDGAPGIDELLLGAGLQDEVDGS